MRGEPGCCVNNAAVLGDTFADGSTGLSRGGDSRCSAGLGVGGFAEYVMTSETGAVKVPDDTPLEIACVIGCAVQTGVGAVLNTAKVEPGATVLVLGLGGIGLSVVQGARVAGAAQIIASDPLDWRDARPPYDSAPPTVLDPGADDVLAATRDLTERRRRLRVRVRGRRRPRRGRRRGDPGRRHRPCSSARRRSTGKLELDPLVLFGISEKKLMGCFLGSCNSLRDIPRMIAMWRAGQLDLEALVTARRPLDEINEAFADLAAGVGIRTVIDLS